MDILLQRQQSFIRQLRQRETTVDVKELFNEMIAFLNNSANDRIDCLHVLTRICNELAGFAALKSFNHLDIINHQFFIILSQTFTMLLTKILFIPLTKEEEQCFDGISLLMSSLCLYKNQIVTCFYTDNNEQLNREKIPLLSYDKIFFTDSFIKKFVRILKTDMAVNEYESYDIRYKVSDRLLYVWKKLNYVDDKSILDSVLQCLKSDVCIKLYKTVQFCQPILTPKQSFFMYQCPKFICMCRHESPNEIIELLRQPILRYGSAIFNKHLSFVFNEEKEDEDLKMRAVAWYIELLNHFALIPETRICFKEKRFFDQSMVDLIISILKNKSLLRSVRRHRESLHGDATLVSYAITLLYNLIYEATILDQSNKNIVIEICEELSTVKDRTIQFAAQTLHAILTAKHIDGMENPTDVARSYLYIIENTIDDLTLTYHGIKLDGVLTNLEKVVQNDDVKEEITNDEEGIPLIARCVYQPNFDEMRIQHPALRIIDAISFASDLAVQQIKENDLLMEYIKELSVKTKANPMPEVERILWKTEKEQLIVKQSKRKPRTPIATKTVFDEKKAVYQYIRGDHRFRLDNQDPLEKFDIMISYCQDDRPLADKLRQRLTESDFDRVKFDKDNIHSWKPKAMAKAVEQSTIIIMCFSSKYRDSYACRLEAEYAMKLKRPIIPVKITAYDPTGWLDDIMGEKTPIDFTRESNTAYDQIINQINEEYDKMDED